MKPIHWIILAIVVIAVIAFFVYYHEKKKKIQAPPKSSGNPEPWLLGNYKILLEKGDLKKGDDFATSMANFDAAVKKVNSLSAGELTGMGYDKSAEGWLKNIWQGYIAGRYSSMEDGIKKEAQSV
jgi:hypothetical protein